MFHVKNHKQACIFDPWGHLGPKRRKVLDESWAGGLFQQKILPELPVEALRKHYHDWNGRPTKELYSMIGLMILQQMHDLTDEEQISRQIQNVAAFWVTLLLIFTNRQKNQILGFTGPSSLTLPHHL